MATTYKVWLEIEEYDDETDEHLTLDFDLSSTAEFATYDDASAFALFLNDVGITADTAYDLNTASAVVAVELRETFDEWKRRRRTRETPEAGLSADRVVIDEIGDANLRH